MSCNVASSARLLEKNSLFLYIFIYFYWALLYHTQNIKWMIMMKCRTIMVLNILL
jgi:hypothetical protein